MGQHHQVFFGNRVRNGVEHQNTMVRGAHARRGARSSKRVRGVPRNQELPFVPPEDWHEPRPIRRGYRIVSQWAGEGFRHVLTPDEVRDRLAQLPRRFIAPLQVVQLSRVTRKKLSFPCYGMQWGPTIYLYPIEESLVESYTVPPKPSQQIEARMYGGRWEQVGPLWRLVWTEQAIKDFYLNNILIHELGHILDNRNTSYIDRERYAEWFAIEYGYKPSRRRFKA
ncbi:MAG: hypothetical protein IT427_15730 [Pirellulales bacterium]|nr:hypothetical protein [Pirellulales bacterium]